MRFIKLRVEAFQGVERAEIEFGPGLNILYGQNDLGKSSLARAIRAALLMAPKSSESEELASWYADSVPRVELTFADDADHQWLVRKAFASGTGANAELLHSKDGKSFSIDSKGREVDEKVRALLRWGIPAPGGRGGPRGLPESFLANVLLAAQTDVHAILAASLENDGDESGKLRLQKALATLAQDPLFKRVLNAAQTEYDLYFTPTGRLRRTQGSKLVAADHDVKRYQRELDELKQELQASRGIEERVGELRELRLQAMGTVADAEAAHSAGVAGLTNARARAEAEKQVAASKVALAQIDGHAARVDELTRERDALASTVAARRLEVDRGQTACEESDAAVKAAEEAMRVVTSEDGEHKRELRGAELSAAAARLDVQSTHLEARREKAVRAQAAATDAASAVRAVEAASTNRGKLARALFQAKQRVDEASQQLELARAVLAYGRWRAALAASEQAAAAKQGAADSRVEATKKEDQARELEERTALAGPGLAERRGQLPTAAELRVLEQMHGALAVAEAALGGGLSVAVRPLEPVHVRVSADSDSDAHDARLATDRVFEAERSFKLRIADLVEVEVTAGAADRRHAAEALREQWKTAGLPVLARANATSLNEIRSALEALETEAKALEELRLQAAQLRSAAEELRQRAQLLSQQAANSSDDPAELAAKRAAVGTFALDLLEGHYTKLGRSWESQAEALLGSRGRERTVAEELRAKLENEAQLADYQSVEAEKAATEQRRTAETAAAVIDGVDPNLLLQTLAVERTNLQAQIAEVKRQVAALANEASSARRTAEKALEVATAQAQHAQELQAGARTVLEDATAALNTKNGEWIAQQEQLARMDRAAALALVQKRDAELQALASRPLATEAEVAVLEGAVARCKRELADKTAEFHKADGALTKGGGAQLRERVEQLEEALVAARARESEIQIDANAWLLLRDTLREAENTQGAHLGKALSGPVGERFVELTQGRYANLCFDPLLTAESMEVAGATSNKGVLAALSVGTRDQLAALVRLTIADQLKSAIILDDHLVHTDPVRLAWFREVLMKTAVETQVLVFTCRPEDYLRKDELPLDGPVRDLAGGSVRAVDLGRVVTRAGGALAREVQGVA